MKIKLVSDLHLEFGEDIEIPRDGVDLLILSGDICTAHDSEKFLPFFERCCKEFPTVVYVMGNHEHYHGIFYHSHSTLLNNLTWPGRTDNLYILDNELILLDGYKIFGGTIWTDMGGGGYTNMHIAERGMNDYRLIKNGDGRLTPSDTIARHKEYLETILKEKPDIVVGHHAPSEKSVSGRYLGERLNVAYFSDLEGFILENPGIKLWTHGHMHGSFDYNIGDTRVLCNAAGYPQKWTGMRENEKFDLRKVIEV